MSGGLTVPSGHDAMWMLPGKNQHEAFTHFPDPQNDLKIRSPTTKRMSSIGAMYVEPIGSIWELAFSL